jgi:hypothetical protein
MEKSMQPQSLSDQDRMVPIDTSGEGVEIELENKEEEQKQEPEVKVEETEAPVKEEVKEEPKAKEEADTSYVADISNRVTAQIDSAQSNLKNAIAAGDVDQQVAYQREIASLTAEEDRVKREKARLEKLAEQKETPVNIPQQPQKAPPQPSAKATAWADKNSWFGEDEVMTYAAYGIHQKLLGEEGYDANSDEYYEEIDKRIKKEFPHKFKDDTTEVQASTRQPVQTVASATRTTKTGRRTVKLTPSQVAIAKKLGVPLEEYAKHVKEA